MVSYFLRQLWTTVGIVLNVTTIGFHFGYPSILLRDLKDPKYGIKLTLQEESWITSALAIGILPSFILTAKIMNKYGRKSTNFFLTIPGAIAHCFFFFGRDKTMLFVGRLFAGINNGGTIMAGSIIISEYSCPKHRGAFLNCKTGGIALGIFLVHTSAIFFDYKTTSLIGLVTPIASFLATFSWPESPFWLAFKGRYEECEKSFFWLRGSSEESKREFQLLIESQKQRRQKLEMTKSDSSWRKMKLILNRMLKKDFLKPTLIVWCIFVILDSNGRLYISSYAVKIVSVFSGNDSEVFYYIVAVDVVMIAGSVLSLFIVKAYKRRTILFVGSTISISLFLSVSLYLFLKSRDFVPQDNVWIAVTLLLSYILILNMTMSPVSLSLLGEVYPLEHRDLGTFITGFLFAFTMFVILKVTPLLITNYDVHGMFGVYAVSMITALVCLFFFLPETEGKTLQEIENHFKGVTVTNKKIKEHELAPLAPEIRN